ncbi:hypothetical protein QTP88_026459 [Uroleucon formosanum]
MEKQEKVSKLSKISGFFSNVPLENNGDVIIINNVNTEVNIESSTSVDHSTSISETIKPEDFTTDISLSVSSEVSSIGMDKNNYFDMVFENIETSSDPTDLGHFKEIVLDAKKNGL